MVENIILIVVIGLILGLAARYIYKAKKRGVKCIGCPDSGSCSGKCSSCCGCRDANAAKDADRNTEE